MAGRRINGSGGGETNAGQRRRGRGVPWSGTNKEKRLPLLSFRRPFYVHRWTIITSFYLYT